MAVNFPDSPTLNQQFTVGDRTWKWDGAKWVALVQGSTSSVDVPTNVPHPFSMIG